MKKILLFVSVVFLTFISEAQTIDSVEVTQYITCVNNTQNITVWSNVPAQTVPFQYVIQYQSCFLGNCTWNQYTLANPDTSALTTDSSFSFNGLVGGVYRVYLVDTSWNYGGSNGVIDSVYFNATGYIPVTIGLVSLTNSENLCTTDCDADRTVSLTNGTLGYTLTVELDSAGTLVNIESISFTANQMINAGFVYLIDSLCVGEYTVTLTDSCLDTDVLTFNIEEPPLLVPGIVTALDSPS